MHQTGKKKRQACIGNVYNYTLQGDPPNVKGNLAAKSSLFVNQDFLLSLDYFETNRSYSVRTSNDKGCFIVGFTAIGFHFIEYN